VIGKTVTHKTSLENGKRVTVTSEEVLNPDGTREVTETTNIDGRVQTNRYTLGAGEKRR